jgi:hypothetical protein
MLRDEHLAEDNRGPVLDLETHVPGFITFLANKLTHGASTLYRKEVMKVSC